MSAGQVSHSPPAFATSLARALAAVPVQPADVPTGALEKLAAFADLLLTWNQRVNLTGARDRETLVHEHFPDAFVLAATAPAGAHAIDVGAGGGLPGLPLAILRSDLMIKLFEPRQKRAAFLRHAIARLGLGTVTVHSDRIEPDAPAPSKLRDHDFAFSRATFAPEVWLPLGLSLVHSGGLVAVLHSDPLASAIPPARALPYQLSGGQTRSLSLFRAP